MTYRFTFHHYIIHVSFLNCFVRYIKMISNDRYTERAQINRDLAVASRQNNKRNISVPHSTHGQITPYNGQITPYNGQITPYNGQMIDRNYPGHLTAPSEVASEKKDPHSSSHKAHQNAEGISKYNKKAKGVVSEGKYAASVEQVHQNDLHNIEKVSEMPQSNDKYAPGNGLVVALPDKSKNIAKDKAAKSELFMEAKPQITYSQDSDLVTSFDPMKDRHTWTMWRTAVNGRIVDEVKRLEKLKRSTASSVPDVVVSGPYGTALVSPPLRQFIRIDNDESRAIADHLSRIGSWSLQLQQFVYFGIPRVRMSQLKR
jgi:hypothetical protein